MDVSTRRLKPWRAAGTRCQFAPPSPRATHNEQVAFIAAGCPAGADHRPSCSALPPLLLFRFPQIELVSCDEDDLVTHGDHQPVVSQSSLRGVEATDAGRPRACRNRPQFDNAWARGGLP